MPPFRVHTVNKLRSAFIQTDTIEGIVSEAKRKLELTGNYKILLDDARTPVDEDFFSYATANPSIVNEIMILPILPENAARNAPNRGGQNIVPVPVVYNGIVYKKGIQRNAAHAEADDSDDEEINRRRRQRDENRKNDEYGCAEYAPERPNGETLDSQESKRRELLALYTNANPQNMERIKTLMTDTYSTQRTALNKRNRNLQTVFTDWPFLKEAEFVILHASKLMGKDMNSIWNKSVNDKFRPMRIFIKIHLKGEENMTKLSTLVRGCKQAMRVLRSHVPKFSIVIPLLTLVLKDKSDIYKLIPTNSTEEDIDTAAPSVHPILIIVGDSIHQAQEFYVMIEKSHRIKCNSFLHGILVTFLCYYVFGYNYPIPVEKSMEFIQRYLLEVNPQTGTKKSTPKKRKVAPICGDLLKLAKKLAEFTSKFQSEDPSDDDDENHLNDNETNTLSESQ
ncbi:hypothetical protein QAD02_007449 [Eretmocerus hayati]|uniref:Uncharacterized protein n=1 Tax=Eretmocerus hayati TaxID=131215 RepID=A0ACC2N654_9HYME|nr:hypothetical protein QAD02_007449 [Eretmocerus hayati]